MSKNGTDKRRRTSYRRWYDNNRADYNEKRRQRYREDQEYRERQIECSLQTRRDSDGTPSSRPVVKLVGGVEVKVWRIGQLSHKVKRSPQILRQWEKRGWLPRGGAGGNTHRYYTQDQVRLVKRLVRVADKYRYAAPGRLAEEMDKAAAVVFAQWEQ